MYDNTVAPQNAKTKGRKARPPHRPTGLSLRTALACVGLFVCSLSMPAFAGGSTSVSIYLYNSQGSGERHLDHHIQ